MELEKLNKKDQFSLDTILAVDEMFEWLDTHEDYKDDHEIYIRSELTANAIARQLDWVRVTDESMPIVWQAFDSE